MIWCALAVIGWVGTGVALAINIYSHKKYKETLEEHDKLQERCETLSQSYAREVETRWRCESDLIDIKRDHQKELSILRAENERIKLKYEHQLDKNIELLEKIIWREEDEGKYG